MGERGSLQSANNIREGLYHEEGSTARKINLLVSALKRGIEIGKEQSK